MELTSIFFFFFKIILILRGLSVCCPETHLLTSKTVRRSCKHTTTVAMQNGGSKETGLDLHSKQKGLEELNTRVNKCSQG